MCLFDAICCPNDGLFQKGKQIINLGAAHFELGCCTSDTALAKNCAYSVLGNSMGAPAEMVASTKRMTNGD